MPRLVINEVDYDQPGADTAEFIEIYNAGNLAASLATIEVSFINGNGGTEYRREALSNAAAMLPAGGYLILGNSAVVAGLPGGTPSIVLPDSSVQNGPDGLALIDTSRSAVLDALSYEGSITAANIPGIGITNLVEGTPTPVVDTGGGSLARVPNGADTNDAATDWALAATPTPAGPN
jgi:hypothetical protein